MNVYPCASISSIAFLLSTLATWFLSKYAITGLVTDSLLVNAYSYSVKSLSIPILASFCVPAAFKLSNPSYSLSPDTISIAILVNPSTNLAIGITFVIPSIACTAQFPNNIPSTSALLTSWFVAVFTLSVISTMLLLITS